ncbi:MAG: hypothetical protein OHK0019_00880 [Saprospiraceae bacterium]
MQKLKYKALVHCGVFVDERRLEKGIYITTTPVLHSFDTTIDDMRSRILEYAQHVQGYSPDKAIESLNQCELQLVELSFI